MGLFKKKKKNNRAHITREIQIGNQKIILNSRGLVPVVLQRLLNDQILVLGVVYMNREALEMSLSSGEAYIFKRSKNRIVKLGEDTQGSVKIDSILLNKNHRALLLTVSETSQTMPHQTFVHTLYPKSYEYEFK